MPAAESPSPLKAPALNRAAASPDSVAAEYEPKTDPALKAKSKDPSWEYSYWEDLEQKTIVTCTLCDFKSNGGIKRLKEHLASGYGDTQVCLKATTAIKKASNITIQCPSSYKG